MHTSNLRILLAARHGRRQMQDLACVCNLCFASPFMHSQVRCAERDSARCHSSRTYDAAVKTDGTFRWFQFVWSSAIQTLSSLRTLCNVGTTPPYLLCHTAAAFLHRRRLPGSTRQTRPNETEFAQVCAD